MFGPKAKVIFVFRHGKKTVDGHIILGCLTDIMENGIPGASVDINMIHRGSAFVRTEETVTALKLWLLRKGAKFSKNSDLPADPRIADKEIFAFFTPDISAKRDAENLTNYEVMKRYGGELFGNYKGKLIVVIHQLFKFNLAPGDICALPAHTPTIEIIFNALSKEENPKMDVPELSGIFIIEDENEKIHVMQVTP